MTYAVHGESTPGTQGSAVPARLRHARVATGVVFAVHGVVTGTFAARIPWLAQHAGVGVGGLGVALLMPGLGAVVAMPLSGRLIHRHDLRSLTRLLVCVFCAALLPPTVATTLVALCPALVVYGASAGVADVVMNAHAVEIERRYGKSVMSGMHGCWSAGGLAGSSAGALAVRLTPNAQIQFLVTAIVLVAVTIAVSTWLLPHRPDPEVGSPPAFALPSRAVLLIGLVGLCAVFAEGAGMDWSAVYVRNVLGHPASTAALTVSTFAVSMAAARFAGDHVVRRIGPVATVRIAGLCATAGGLAVVLDRNLALVFAGFALIGIGIAVVVPLVFAAAGRIGPHPGRSIAGVAGISYGSGLVAPGVIGGIARLSSLTMSYVVVVVLMVAMAAGPGCSSRADDEHEQACAQQRGALKRKDVRGALINLAGHLHSESQAAASPIGEVGVVIEHVVVLCLENRSFDHMLGFLDHPAGDFDGLTRGGPYQNPGWGRRARPVPATAQAKPVLPFGPDHSHDAAVEQLGLSGRVGRRHPVNDGFVRSYERKGRGLDPPRLGGLLGPVLNWWLERQQKAAPTARGRGPLVMLCQDPARVPVLSRLALDFAVCDQWFCSVPGETWPNRNFLHAATSDGETDIEIRFYTNRTIFELLEDNGASWRIYFDDTPQVWAFPALWDTPARHANWYPSARFAEHAAAGDLPRYSFIEPNHRPPLHTLDHDIALGGRPDVSDSQHPENNLVSNQAYDTFTAPANTDFSRGEGLIAFVYEALRANPDLFARTLLLITYDEHGGFYDHVPPPTGVPAPGGGRGPAGSFLHAIWHRQAESFDFTMLGPRVPAVVVSPLIEAGTVDHHVRDHASVPATLRTLFAPDAQPLTARDRWAPPFHDLVTRDVPRTDLPDLSAYRRPRPDHAALAAGPAGPPAAYEAVPGYFEDFLKQADEVRSTLTSLGEPEMADATSSAPFQRAAETSEAFQAAAHRHRHLG